MKVKQIISTGILTIMLVTIGSSGISALANNSGDTAFDFYFPSAISSNYTSPRNKTDASSVWVQCTGGSPFTASIANTNHKSLRCNPIYASPGSGQYMITWAYEDNGYRSLPITLHGTSGGYPSRGVWSPDSV